MKLKYIFFLSIIFFTGCMRPYSYPSYSGKVIDAETKEPIKGAVVAVEYQSWRPSLGGRISQLESTQEVETNDKGEFVVPSYWGILYHWEVSIPYDHPFFYIYKPGYLYFPLAGGHERKCPNPPFEKVPGYAVCKEGEVIALPRLKNKEEQLRHPPLYHGKFKKMQKLVDEERNKLLKQGFPAR